MLSRLDSHADRSSDLDLIDSRVAEMRGRKAIVEIPLTSRIPVAGAFVVASRRLWGWLGTVWYVRPLLQQQNILNELFSDTLTRLATLERKISVEVAENTLRSRASIESALETERLLIQVNKDLARLERRVRELERFRQSGDGDSAKIAPSPRRDE
jgi:hypothetical protein